MVIANNFLRIGLFLCLVLNFLNAAERKDNTEYTLADFLAEENNKSLFLEDVNGLGFLGAIAGAISLLTPLPLDRTVEFMHNQLDINFCCFLYLNSIFSSQNQSGLRCSANGGRLSERFEADERACIPIYKGVYKLKEEKEQLTKKKDLLKNIATGYQENLDEIRRRTVSFFLSMSKIKSLTGVNLPKCILKKILNLTYEGLPEDSNKFYFSQFEKLKKIEGEQASKNSGVFPNNQQWFFGNRTEEQLELCPYFFLEEINKTYSDFCKQYKEVTQKITTLDNKKEKLLLEVEKQTQYYNVHMRQNYLMCVWSSALAVMAAAVGVVGYCAYNTVKNQVKCA